MFCAPKWFQRKEREVQEKGNGDRLGKQDGKGIWKKEKKKITSMKV
jgi:hypothetical protein